MQRLVKRLLTVPALAVVGALVMPALPANAHGEAAQEAFLRMGTVAYYDVKFSKTHVAQGEEFTISGTAKILDTWPEQLAEPELGFISVVAPGPVVVIRERTINGDPAPHAIEIEKGGVYQFEMKLAGRRPGQWHVHPILGVHGAGSLLGPGRYIHVTKSEAGFSEPVKLASGGTIDLETVGNGTLTFWAIVWAVVGLAWLLYWIVPKPTVTRLPVTSQIPLNTDGMEYGLITKRDHKMMNLIVGVTLALLAAGWVYQAQAYPNKMPQQVLRFAPPKAPAAAEFVTASVSSATFDPHSDTVRLTVDVDNTGSKPATLQAFTTSTLTFATQGVAAPVDGRSASVSPNPTVAPGQKASLTLTMADEIWEKERLMPLNESRMQITGLLRFEDSSGVENVVTVQSFVKPERA